MTVQTLDDLKAVNAATDDEGAAATPAIDPAEFEAAAEDTTGALDGSGEGDQESDDEGTVEAWQATDEDGEDGKEQKRGPSYSGLRKKLKAKISTRDDEISSLRAEVEQMRQARQQPAARPMQPQMPRPPTLEDVGFDEGKLAQAQGQYQAALIEQQVQAQMQQQQAQYAQQQARQQASQAVDGHYDRAAKLVGEGLVSEDVYHAADQVVRESIESAMPGQGAQVTDFLLGQLGEGSEKLVVHLGRNQGPRAELQRLLQQDPNGISAAMYLGKLQAQVTNPARRVSNAPRPGAKSNGDARSTSGSAHLKAYKKARGDPQARLNAKWAAKDAGVDVSGWK